MYNGNFNRYTFTVTKNFLAKLLLKMYFNYCNIKIIQTIYISIYFVYVKIKKLSKYFYLHFKRFLFNLSIIDGRFLELLLFSTIFILMFLLFKRF